jgi:hypothetical protein
MDGGGLGRKIFVELVKVYRRGVRPDRCGPVAAWLDKNGRAGSRCGLQGNPIMSYKDLKQPAGDTPTMSANDPGETKPQADDRQRHAQNNEHGSGHGHSDAKKNPM